jgi:hypothetical protein
MKTQRRQAVCFHAAVDRSAVDSSGVGCDVASLVQQLCC